jgi:hypothetical protein
MSQKNVGEFLPTDNSQTSLKYRPSLGVWKYSRRKTRRAVGWAVGFNFQAGVWDFCLHHIHYGPIRELSSRTWRCEGCQAERASTTTADVKGAWKFTSTCVCMSSWCVYVRQISADFFTTVLSRWMMIKRCNLQMLHDARSSKQGVTWNNQDNATDVMLCEARMDSSLVRLSSSVKLLWVILIWNVGIFVTVTQLQTSL